MSLHRAYLVVLDPTFLDVLLLVTARVAGGPGVPTSVPLSVVVVVTGLHHSIRGSIAHIVVMFDVKVLA